MLTGSSLLFTKFELYESRKRRFIIQRSNNIWADYGTNYELARTYKDGLCADREIRRFSVIDIRTANGCQ